MLNVLQTQFEPLDKLGDDFDFCCKLTKEEKLSFCQVRGVKLTNS